MIDHQAETLRPLIGKNVKLRMEDGMATIGTDDGWELHIYNSFSLHCDGIAEPPALNAELGAAGLPVRSPDNGCAVF
ncbi:hypothetical protein NMB32_10180 [Stenotrophomonas sp. CD2]|nr:hypothetical protein NMB32_10180 [Stenotrophomonas sp. CD2]